MDIEKSNECIMFRVESRCLCGKKVKCQTKQTFLLVVLGFVVHNAKKGEESDFF